MTKKRSQGEGSIYRWKDRPGVAQVTIQGKYLSKYFKLQSEARESLQTTKAQMRRGLICNTIYSSMFNTAKYRKGIYYEQAKK